MRLLVFLAALSTLAPGQSLRQRPVASPYTVPHLKTLVPPGSADLRALVERYQLDRDVLARFYDVPVAATRHRALRQFFEAWAVALDGLPSDGFGQHGRIDYLLLERCCRSATVFRGSVFSSVSFGVYARCAAVLRSAQRNDGEGTNDRAGRHDVVTQLNSIPVEMARATPAGERLMKNFHSTWQSYGEVNR